MYDFNLTIAAIKNLKQVGSIVPSSSFLVKKIIKDIDFDKRLNILELGAGNGVITKEILGRMSPDSMLYSYENNATLIDMLEHIHDERLIVKGESVANLKMLDDDYFDVVVSSLPLANLDNEFKNAIYTDIKSKIKDSGIFIQYQYLLLDYKKIEKSFSNCRLDFCLLNFPPAFIYKIDMLKYQQAI